VINKLAKNQIAWIDTVAMAVGIALALLLRYSLKGYISGDFISFFGRWYAAIQAQGLAATGSDVANYTPPYLYLLYLVNVLLPRVSALTATKIPGILFDFVCAWFVSRMVHMRYAVRPDGKTIAILAFFAVLFAPTVVLNSAAWGQSDSIYTAMLVGCVYFLMSGRKNAAALVFGVAFAFKAQALYLAPLLLLSWLKGYLSWKNLLWIPLVYLIAMLPAWIAGRPLVELLTIYLTQSETYRSLTMNAPSMYAWLRAAPYEVFYPAGIAWTLCLLFLFVFTGLKSSKPLTPSRILKLATLSVMMMPFFLPKMHDRYFYPADVLTIAYGFTFPQLFYVPILVNLVSFFAYQPFLFNRTPISFELLASAMLAAIVFVAKDLITDLFDPKTPFHEPSDEVV
jgi:Gpi18-like mannosyltransferase